MKVEEIECRLMKLVHKKEGVELTEKNAVKKAIEELSYRKGAYITEYHMEYNCYAFPICPKCGHVIEREYQYHCTNCGQKLKWCSRKIKNSN